MSYEDNHDELVRREVEIPPEAWAGLKPEADLDDDVSGVRQLGGKLLKDYKEGNLSYEGDGQDEE